MVKIAVIGSRNFSDYSFFREKLEAIIINLKDFDLQYRNLKAEDFK